MLDTASLEGPNFIYYIQYCFSITSYVMRMHVLSCIYKLMRSNIIYFIIIQLSIKLTLYNYLHNKPRGPNNVGCKHKQTTLYPLLFWSTDQVCNICHVRSTWPIELGPFNQREHHCTRHTDRATHNLHHPRKIPQRKSFKPSKKN